MQSFFAPTQIIFIIAGPARNLTPVNLDNASRNISEKLPIMGNEHHGARIIF